MQWSTVLAFAFCWSFSPAFCQTVRVKGLLYSVH